MWFERFLRERTKFNETVDSHTRTSVSRFESVFIRVIDVTSMLLKKDLMIKIVQEKSVRRLES